MSSRRRTLTAAFSSRVSPVPRRMRGFSRATSCSPPMASGFPPSRRYAPRWKDRAATSPCSSSGAGRASSYPCRWGLVEGAGRPWAANLLAFVVRPAEVRPGLRVESRLEAAEIVGDGGDVSRLQGGGHAIHDRILAIACLILLQCARDIAGVLPGE